MRKLVLNMQVSVDGYVDRRGDGPQWQVWDWGQECPWDAKLKERFNNFFKEADCILLSRKIVEGGYVDHWANIARNFPHLPEFAFAKRIVEARKIIFSHTLKETRWPGTELARRPLVEEVNDLKRQEGRNIVAFGGAGFVSSLIGSKLVDEFEFYTSPVALHEGLSIFGEKGRDSNLRLISAEPYECGIVVSRYASVEKSV